MKLVNAVNKILNNSTIFTIKKVTTGETIEEYVRILPTYEYKGSVNNAFYDRVAHFKSDSAVEEGDLLYSDETYFIVAAIVKESFLNNFVRVTASLLVPSDTIDISTEVLNLDTFGNQIVSLNPLYTDVPVKVIHSNILPTGDLKTMKFTYKVVLSKYYDFNIGDVFIFQNMSFYVRAVEPSTNGVKVVMLEEK